MGDSCTTRGNGARRLARSLGDMVGVVVLAVAILAHDANAAADYANNIVLSIAPVGRTDGNTAMTTSCGSCPVASASTTATKVLGSPSFEIINLVPSPQASSPSIHVVSAPGSQVAASWNDFLGGALTQSLNSAGVLGTGFVPAPHIIWTGTKPGGQRSSYSNCPSSTYLSIGDGDATASSHSPSADWIETGMVDGKVLCPTTGYFVICACVPPTSSSPTASPTAPTTWQPTKSPTLRPTSSPTHAPTRIPTSSPTSKPTKVPTKSPTLRPTLSPTYTGYNAPTFSPTNPTRKPTKSPTLQPTHAPTASPVTPSSDAAAGPPSPGGTSTPSPHTGGSLNNDDSMTAIIGGVAGGLGAVLVGGYLLYRRKRRLDEQSSAVSFNRFAGGSSNSYATSASKKQIGRTNDIQASLFSQHEEARRGVAASSGGNSLNRVIPAPPRPPSAQNTLYSGGASNSSVNPAAGLEGPLTTMLYDFFGEVGAKEELSVEAGEMVMVLQQLEDWSLVRSMTTGDVGMVPTNHIAPLA